MTKAKRPNRSNRSVEAIHGYDIEVVFNDEDAARKWGREVERLLPPSVPLISQHALRDGYALVYGPIERDNYRGFEGRIYTKLGNAVRVRLVQRTYAGGPGVDEATRLHEEAHPAAYLPVNIGEKIRFEAHGRSFLVGYHSRNTYWLATDPPGERRRWGTRDQITEDIEYVLANGALPPASGSMWEGRRVADFNTLDDLIEHARQEGATHVLHVDDEIHIYFQRRDGQYEKAEVWQRDGYWHAQGPGKRAVVPRPPRDAQPIGSQARTNEGRRRGPQIDPALIEAFAADVNALRQERRITFEQAYDSITKPEWWREYQAQADTDQMIKLDSAVLSKAKSIARARRRLSEGARRSDIDAAVASFNRGDAYRDGSLRLLVDRRLVEYNRGWRPTAAGVRAGLHHAGVLGEAGPRGGSARRISGRAPQMTPEAVMKIAGDLSRKVRGSAPKHIGAHRWSDRNESAVFTTYSPEFSQKVVVLVSVFEDGTLALDFFSDEWLSETNRYENIVHFLYSTVDLGEMKADLTWVWETVDGYAESWQQGEE